MNSVNYLTRMVEPSLHSMFVFEAIESKSVFIPKTIPLFF